MITKQEITLREDPVTEAQADVIINSANGALIHGSGAAGDLSEASGELTKAQRGEYISLVRNLSGTIGRVYRNILALSEQGEFRELSLLQLSSAKLFVGRTSPFSQGEIALTDSGKLGAGGGAKWIVHAVGMTYDFERWEYPEKPPIVPATAVIIRDAIGKSLKLIAERGLGTSVAIPIMCVRKGGLTYEESLDAIHQGVKEAREHNSIEKIVIATRYGTDK